MKRIKYLLLVFLFFKDIQEFKCQLSVEEDYKAHRKYWFYRTRLINDFMKVGKNQGDCIVFPERNRLDVKSCEPLHSAKVGPDQIDITNQYLAALALEFKLLSRSNQNTDETVKEIYYLLYTINRLDAEADQFWTNPPSGANQNITPNYATDLNGFILREDMPRDYIGNNIKHFNYSQNEDPGSNSGYTGIEYIDQLSRDNHFSFFENFSVTVVPCSNPSIGADQNVNKRLVIPHDKLYSMYAAFMFLMKYLPDNISYYENGQLQTFQDNEANIKQEIKNITDRTYKYIRGELFSSPVSVTWEPKFPDGQWLSLNGLGTVKPMCFALALMACQINPANSVYYLDQYVTSIGAASFETFQALVPTWNSVNDVAASIISQYNITPADLTSNDMAVFLAYCQVGGNVPLGPVPEWLAMHANVVAKNLPWSELMRKVLHENGLIISSLNNFSDPISTAPCNGPYNFGPGQYPAFDWSAQDRFEHADKMGDNGAPTGRYPGVDFMLLHNLYYEYLNQQADANALDGKRNYAYNLMDNYDEQIWPRNTHQVDALTEDETNILEGVNETGGSTQVVLGPPPAYHSHNVTTVKMPANVKVFQYLNSAAKIYATASPAAPDNTTPSQVTYRAGKEIHLLPGFEAKSGSTFNAYIQRYLCNGSNYENGMRSADPQNERSFDYETDIINTYAPIHHVYGPQTNNIPSLAANTELKSKVNREEQIKIFPNPGNGRYSFKTGVIDQYEIKVYNIQGVLMATVFASEKEQEINIEYLANGIYFFNIKNSKGEESNLKVIKQ